MNIFQRIFSRPKRQEQKRFFKAAAINDLLADWLRQEKSINDDLKNGVLERLWARARNLYQNNPYFARYVQLVAQNVLGPNGFQLRVKLDTRGTGDPQNIADYKQRVQRGFLEWIDRADVDLHTWYEVQRLCLNLLTIYGEGFIVFGENKTTFQVLSPIFCPPVNLERTIERRKYTFVLGVGMSADGRKMYRFVDARQVEVFVPAERVVHFFVKDFPEQVRGYPKAASVMIALHHLSGYEEAELVAARIASAKMGFYIVQNPGEVIADSQYGDGTLVDEVSPGQFVQLPPGVDVKTFDAQHPKTTFAEFQKAILRSVASGLGISYVSLANDLESVNYSSARVGMLEEREFYKTMQKIFVEKVLNPIFWTWYDRGVQLGTFDRQNVEPVWTGRRWDWVDPLKDAQALRSMLDLGLTTFSDVLAQQGKDIDEHIEDLKAEKEKMKQAGIILPFGYE